MNENSEIVDLKPRISDFKTEIIESLSADPKKISPKFFYDENGSRLFDQITQLEEYYPTRSEIEILDTKCREIATFIGEGTTVIELGGGNGTKGSKLLTCLIRPSSYVMVDISMESLSIAKKMLSSKFPDVQIKAVWADYTKSEVMEKLDLAGNKAIVFLGSTIGNMEPAEARSFIESCRSILAEGESLTVGVDLKKDKVTLEKAYNDSLGITAQFNLNLLRRINMQFGQTIDESAFRHVAFYNVEKGRIEMHLESTKNQKILLDGKEIEFLKGETIHTENSYKYSIEEFTGLLREAGFSKVVKWTDSKGNYALFAARV